MTSANPPGTAPADETTCCGQAGPWSPAAGAPLGVSCQLCPRAGRVYYRRARPDGQPYEPVKPLSDGREPT